MQFVNQNNISDVDCDSIINSANTEHMFDINEKTPSTGEKSYEKFKRMSFFHPPVQELVARRYMQSKTADKYQISLGPDSDTHSQEYRDYGAVSSGGTSGSSGKLQSSYAASLFPKDNQNVADGMSMAKTSLQYKFHKK